jgi:microcystin-dependent protein
MAEPFLAEIRLFSFGYAPRGWAQCNGQLLPINQNQALFALLGITYGGNGQTTFALPNLMGRTPIHFNGAFPLGNSGGQQAHTLTPAELPSHSHSMAALTADAVTREAAGNLPAHSHDEVYSTQAQPLVAGAPVATSLTGGSQPHSNMQPFLTLNFCIALQGLFPSMN